MKKIVLGCAAVLLSLGLLAGCNKEDDDVGPGPVEGGSGTVSYVLGVKAEGTMYYATGETLSGYNYEGELTTNLDEAVEIKYSLEGSDEYYVTFEKSGTTYYVAIETLISESDGNEHTNLQYTTTKTPLYLHTDSENEYFCNADGSYFLCYNSTYSCLYASSVTSDYGPGNSKASPVAGIYQQDGTLVLGGKGAEAVESEPEPNADTGGTVGADPADVTPVEVTPDLIVSGCTHQSGSNYVLGSSEMSSDYTPCELDGETTTISGWNFSISWNKGESSTSPRLWSGTPNHFRVYNKNTFTITPAEGYELRVVKFTDTNKFLTASGAYVSVTEGEQELTGGEDYVVDTGVFTMNTIESTSGVTIEIGNTTANGGHVELSSISIGVSEVTGDTEPQG